MELQLRTFLDTQSDPEDVGEKGCLVLDNFDMSNSGKLTIRPGKTVSAFLDETTCNNLERCNTSLGKFWLGYDSNNKRIFMGTKP